MSRRSVKFTIVYIWIFFIIQIGRSFIIICSLFLTLKYVYENDYDY